MTRPWRHESLDCEQSEGDAQRPTAAADRAAALDLDLWIPRIYDVEQLTIQVWTQWILMDVHRIRNGTRTKADVIFISVKGDNPRPPAWNTPASGGMWPSASWFTWGPTPQMT